MLSGSESSAMPAEKAAFEKLIEAITTTKDGDILKFVEKLRKYLNHAQFGISFTPSQKIAGRLGMLNDLWKRLKNSAPLTQLGEATLAMFEKDLTNNCDQLRQYFPKESDELDDLMSDLSRPLEQKTLPDAKLFVPGSIRSGYAHHFSAAKPLPLIEENERGVRLFNEGKPDESIALFQQSLEILDALPHKGSHFINSLYDLKSNLAVAKCGAARQFYGNGDFDKARLYVRDALIEQEQIIELSLPPGQQVEAEKNLTDFRKLYVKILNQQIDTFADENKEEEIIHLLEKIYADETLKRGSRLKTIDVKRRVAVANNKIGRYKCDINTVESTISYLNTAMLQAAEIITHPEANASDSKFFYGCMENLYAFLFEKAMESISQKNYSDAISRMLRILVKLNLLNLQNMSPKLIMIQRQTLAEFNKHLFNYLTQDITAPQITLAISSVAKIINHIPALVTVLNKTVASIAIIYAYAQFHEGYAEAALGTLMLMSSEIKFTSTVPYDDSYIFIPDHPLNNLLASVVFIRDAFKPEAGAMNDRDQDIAAVSTRLIGIILLEQCKSFSVENHETYLPCFLVAQRACEIFTAVGTDYPMDKNYFELSKTYMILMRTSLIAHIQTLIINLKLIMGHRICFFNQQFSQNSTFIPELFNLMSRLHLTHDIASLAEITNGLGEYLVSHPALPHRPLLIEIHEVATKLVTLNQIYLFGRSIDEYVAQNSAAQTDIAAPDSMRP